MRDFTALISKIDSTNKTNSKVEHLVEFFNTTSDKDKLWAIALLSHRRPKRPANTTLLRKWASDLSEIPPWLFEESYHITGDLAETIALLVPQKKYSENRYLSEIIDIIIELKGKSEKEIEKAIKYIWLSYSKEEKFVFNKILTGGFRIGVSQKLMTRALSKHLDKPENEVAHRLMGDWDPRSTNFKEMFIEAKSEDKASKPYPFYLAYPIENKPKLLGATSDWFAERKWDGIRGQIIKRNDEYFLWSRGEDLLTDKFPDYMPIFENLPDGVVLDGEVICHNGIKPMPFNNLQTRIGRKNISKKILQNAPARFIAYDVLEFESKDIRETEFAKRREILENIVNNIKNLTERIILSPKVKFNSWDQLAEERKRSREYLCEGIMLKRKDSRYGVGRKKGDWWKWKIDPMTIDAVLTYAMQGHGRRANLFTDYTFGLWQEGKLVTFTKAYSGLTDKEIREVDKFVRKNTIEKFGPVRQVQPQLVFEIAFEGIAESKRHKSGVALRFPRILRWRKDKKSNEANTLKDLKNFIEY